MSQAGIINVIENNPGIPIFFDANTGSATALFNVINIVGAGGITTTASGNTLVIHGTAFGQTITGQSGGALSPTAGNWNIFGASVAAGTSPVVTSGVVSTLTVNVQRSQALASSDSTKVGLSNFDSAAFDVDANGFVQLNGGGIAATSFDVQSNTAPGTDPVVPSATGSVIVNGAAVANHSVVLETRSRAINAYNLEVQYATSAASTDATKSGVAHFDSSRFTVDANGFVSLTSTGVLETLTGNSGGAISPTSGNINTVGTGSITVVGSGSTLTSQLTGLTNHAVLVGAGTATITNVGPTATVGQVLQSAGASADPAFSTATYPLTTTINQILYSSAANTVIGLATANNGVLTTGISGTPVITALSSNGQIIIGSGSGAPSAATLTAGAGVSITNGANSITIAVTGAGLVWTDVTTATQALSVENGYVTDRGAGVVYTLPSTATLGDEIIILGKLGLTTITPNANQQILMGAGSATVGATGTAVGTNVGDCITLNCITAGASTVWRAASWVGNWTLT